MRKKKKWKKGSSNCFLGKGHKAEQPTCNGQMNTMWGSSLEQSPNLKLSLLKIIKRSNSHCKFGIYNWESKARYVDITI